MSFVEKAVNCCQAQFQLTVALILVITPTHSPSPEESSFDPLPLSPEESSFDPLPKI